MLRNSALFLLSLVASLGLAEVVVQAFVPVRDVGPSFTVYDPVLGKRLKASFSAERITPEFRMRLSTNSLGFRGPEPKAISSGPILFLGDSFTMGYGVRDGEEYPARVATELRRLWGDSAPSVINAGIGDSGNGFWIKFLRSRAPAMHPRVVVMQLADNDFEDNLNEKLFALGPDGSLRELPVPGPGMMRGFQAVIEAFPGLSASHVVGLLRQIRFPAFGALRIDAESESELRAREANALTMRIVEEAISLCRTQGFATLGVLVGLSISRELAITELFARHGAPVVVIPAKSARPDLYYTIDGHAHAAGHAFIANHVLEPLRATFIAATQSQAGRFAPELDGMISSAIQ